MADRSSSLQDAAQKRQERIKQLRQKRLGEQADSAEGKRHAAGESLAKPVFRSYRPTDESLQEHAIADSKPVSLEESVAEQLEAGRPAPVIEEVDLINLAPRKPDWDLKRDVARKLERLDKRTQKAIAELIRERLQTGKVSDLASAVAAVTEAAENAGDSD
ncbi:PREDICTED: coiled-coil domain-containing protein 12-like [Priapulus caudatus]|uniref:Coiled-coil domain-containing protein 12-like n=1 Tax=Priapulus caudatus TaxID=37621 RepID=A0ABM1EBU8_PRICU|nr:PREDICTED: coiled-coil domain-containing protein 12-like [Priapulus caudatus]